jgi:hypothetical protein
MHTAPRDAANAAYEQVAELLVAAEGLKDAVRREGASEAFAPALGCLEEALGLLATASAELGAAALAELAIESRSSSEEFAAAVRRLGELQRALASAARASAAAREVVGPQLAAARP